MCRHDKKLGFTDRITEEGENIVYIDKKEMVINTGEKVITTDYDEANPDTIIVNNKYIFIWI